MKVRLYGKDLALLKRWEDILRPYGPEIVDTLTDEEGIVVADLATVGREVAAFLRRRGPGAKVRIVGLEGAPSVERAKSWLAAGLKGYGNAYMLPVHLRSCVQTVAEGGVWVYPEFVTEMVRTLSGEAVSQGESPLPENLTAREREIARLALEGASNREIAEKLGITERTVKAHLGKVYEKAQVANRLELALRYKKAHA
ncbi:LuxR C-terminal-related transcriptional regulator [Hydrogenimonas sp.]